MQNKKIVEDLNKLLDMMPETLSYEENEKKNEIKEMLNKIANKEKLG